ncbi:hypothetical protein NP493_876g01010 [Ridgeia piscesae]|uniref:Septin-type G domain-containing protein n=1 Tax=Ridgeia piscesae TaxID=27915 RepID=A0AAD9KLM0_RIDPI|nr:hypothetical protein NP493_876g01010 [Ridgeia piscesae]
MEGLNATKTSRTSSFVKQQQTKLTDQMSTSENWQESASGLSQLDKARYMGKRPPKPPPQPPLQSQNSTGQEVSGHEHKAASSREQQKDPPSPLSGFGKPPAKPPLGLRLHSQNSTESPGMASHKDKVGTPSPTDKTGQTFFTGKASAPWQQDKVSGFGKRPAKPPPGPPLPSQNATGSHKVSLPPGPGFPVETSVEAMKPRSVNHVEKVTLSSEHCMGFASLPEQVHRKAVRRGFDFTLMVVGETGLGKSTLISSLFLNNDFYKNRENPSVEERVTKTVEIELKKMEIEEKGIRLRLTIVDTPGFNDSLKGEESWRTIEEYIDKQFAQYYKDESGINRKNINDTRVHCCLYFVSPYGHGLRPIDVQFMKQLHQKVNIVPVIAKADTLTKIEIRRLKERVLEQISNNKIQIYTFPDCDSDEDEEFIQEDKELKASIPFAVIGSTTKVEVNGKKVRGRLYPWGIVEVDNPEHCDFTKLRQMLISTHMQDLKDMTRDVHYENYRAQYIKQHIISGQRERTKLKRESTQNIENVQYTDHLLQAKEDEIQRMQEMLSKMKAQLDGNNRTAVNGVGRP